MIVSGNDVASFTAQCLREMQEIAARQRFADAKRTVYPKLSGVGSRERERRVRQAARA